VKTCANYGVGALPQLWYDIAQDGALWAKIYRSLWPGKSTIGKANDAIEDWYGCWKIRLRYALTTHCTMDN
jgi:hypothetical protein